MRRLRGDRGSATVEVVIITPVALALLCLVAFVGRTATAREQVGEAARDAARAASLERDPDAAWRAAHDSANLALTGGGFQCATTTVEVDTTSFGPGGQVTVTVRCELPLSDLAMVGIHGTRSVESSSVSVVDSWRAAP